METLILECCLWRTPLISRMKFIFCHRILLAETALSYWYFLIYISSQQKFFTVIPQRATTANLTGSWTFFFLLHVFQMLLSETHFTSVVTEVVVPLVYKQKKKPNKNPKQKNPRKQTKKRILVEGENLGLWVLFFAMNTLKENLQHVSGKSAQIADGCECKHTEDHVHALNVFTRADLSCIWNLCASDWEDMILIVIF